MSVYEKLIKVQNELKAPKSKYNSFGKYKYRSLEDILEGVKPLLNKYNATLVISDTITQVGDRYYLSAEAAFIDTETGDKISNSAMARESADKKGMDDSQITGTASSYARKYALNGLFLIDDTKDADTDEAHVEREARAEQADDDRKNEELMNKVGSQKIDSLKLDVLRLDIKEGHTTEEGLLKYFKVEKLEDITEAQFSRYAIQKNKKKGAK